MIDFDWFVFGMLFMGISGIFFGLVTGFFLGMERTIKKIGEIE